MLRVGFEAADFRRKRKRVPLPEKQITAVIVAYNSAEVLPRCLDSLASQGVASIVVDNASSDDTAAVARAAGASILRNDRNEGFGRAANLGVGHADSAFVLLVNPDIEMEQGSVAELLEAAGRYPDAALVAPRLIEGDGRVFFQPRSFLAGFLTNEKGRRWMPEGDCCLPFLSGAALLIRISAWRALGGFDPAIFLFYEDDDLCRRFSDAGWSLVHADAARARHARGGSNAPSLENTYRRRWHLAWSRGYVASKYGMKPGMLGMLAVNAAKWLGASLLGRAERRARYGGSLGGAYAWLTGASALSKEGLKEREQS